MTAATWRRIPLPPPAGSPLTARAAPHPVTARAAPNPTADRTAPNLTADRTDPARTVVLAALAARAAVPVARAAPAAPARAPAGPGPASGPSLAALVTLTIPLATWQRRSEAPGEADGFGPLDGDDARDLAAAAARHPRTRWCLTALNPDGTAAAHGCLPGRTPPARHRAPPPPGPAGPAEVPLTPVTRGPCDHARAETGYHPSRKLAHLIRARNGRCTAPGCTRPAARCDLDHTRPWDEGGRDLRMQPGSPLQTSS